MMIGNSMRADVTPAIDAGAWGIHIPSDYVWSMDLDDDGIMELFDRAQRIWDASKART